MQLTKRVCDVRSNFPKAEMFGLTSQMRRAAVSIPSNIAEGYGRATDKAFALFLVQARGSIFELQTQIEISTSLGYLDPQRSKALQELTEDVAKLLNGLLRTMRETTPKNQSQNQASDFC